MLLFEVLLKQKESNRVVVFQFNLKFSLEFSQSFKQSWVICVSFCFDAVVGQARISFRAKQQRKRINRTRRKLLLLVFLTGVL